MKTEYLQDAQLVFLQKIILGKLDQENYSTKDDSIVFNYSDIEAYANKGIDLLILLNTFEIKLNIKVAFTIYPEKLESKSIIFESFDEFLKTDYFIEYTEIFCSNSQFNKEHSDLFDIVSSSHDWLLNTIIEIKDVSSIKEKINEFLNQYILDYENGRLEGINVLTLQRHNDFFLKLFDSLKNLDQRNLLIDSEILSNNLTNFYNLNVETKGQMKFLEHLLFFESRKYIKIKDVDFSEAGSTIPWKITIAIITPLSEIADKEKIQAMDFPEPPTLKDELKDKDKLNDKTKLDSEDAKGIEEIKSKKSSRMPIINEELGKVSFNGKEWTLKTKNSKQFYVLRIILNRAPGMQMTIEEIKRYYRNNEDALEILDSNSGRWVEDLVRDINANAKKHLEIDELLRCKGSTIELLKI